MKHKKLLNTFNYIFLNFMEKSYHHKLIHFKMEMRA